jgi:hypothetical protein
MKITKSQLRKIIKEEIQKEGFGDRLAKFGKAFKAAIGPRDEGEPGGDGSYIVDIVNTRDTSGSWRQVNIPASSLDDAIAKAVKKELQTQEIIGKITAPNGNVVYGGDK